MTMEQISKFIEEQKKIAENELRESNTMIFGNNYQVGKSDGKLLMLRELEKFISVNQKSELSNL